jgi:hypothetical protein
MRRRQLHVSLSDDDHDFLARYALERDEAVAVVVRRLIRQLKRASSTAPSGPGASAPPSSDRGGEGTMSRH